MGGTLTAAHCEGINQMEKCVLTAYNMVEAYGAPTRGIHHGWNFEDETAIFSKIQNAELVFGVYVQTG